MTNYITVTNLKNTLTLDRANLRQHQPGVRGHRRVPRDQQLHEPQLWPVRREHNRYFTPNRLSVIEIDNLTTLVSFKTAPNGDGSFSNTWTMNTDFVLEPLNAAANGYPYERIRVHPLSSYAFPNYPYSVQIVGTWGWAAVPAAIKAATTLLAARFFRRPREAAFGVAGMGFELRRRLRVTRQP